MPARQKFFIRWLARSWKELVLSACESHVPSGTNGSLPPRVLKPLPAVSWFSMLLSKPDVDSVSVNNRSVVPNKLRSTWWGAPSTGDATAVISPTIRWGAIASDESVATTSPSTWQGAARALRGFSFDFIPLRSGWKIADGTNTANNELSAVRGALAVLSAICIQHNGQIKFLYEN